MDISEYDSSQRDQRAEAKKGFEATVEKLITLLENVCQAVKESAIQPEIEELEQKTRSHAQLRLTAAKQRSFSLEIGNWGTKECLLGFRV